MAKLKAFVNSLDDVADEALRELYVEDTDAKGAKRFKLDADGLEDVSGLKSTVTQLRTENRQLKERVKPLAELGDDEDLDALIAAGKAELERQKTGKGRDEVENVKSQMAAQHQKELNKLKARIEGQTDTLREVLIANEVRAAAADPELKGNATLLLPHIERMTKIDEEEDPETGRVRFAARVLGPDKKVRVDKDGNPLSVKGLVAELRENPDFADAFKGSGASGSGTPPDGGSGMPTPPRRTAAAPAVDAKTTKRTRQDYGAI